MPPPKLVPEALPVASSRAMTTVASPTGGRAPFSRVPTQLGAHAIEMQALTTAPPPTPSTAILPSTGPTLSLPTKAAPSAIHATATCVGTKRLNSEGYSYRQLLL